MNEFVLRDYEADLFPCAAAAGTEGNNQQGTRVIRPRDFSASTMILATVVVVEVAYDCPANT